MKKRSRDAGKAIAIFDSGVGGLTVAREIMRVLPGERLLYLGDTARFPYGMRSRETVSRMTDECVNLLLSNDIKLLVIACNTATAFAYDDIRERHPSLPVVGVIEPCVHAVASKIRSGAVGVIGTEGTIHSGIYAQKLKIAAPALKTYSVACPLFVPIIEEGIFKGPLVNHAVDLYLKRFKRTGIRAIILGCTHYPFFKTKIRDYFNGRVKVMDSATRTAAAVAEKLGVLGLRAPRRRVAFGDHRFMVTDYPEKFRRTGELFLGQTLLIEKVTI
ncbi:MAG: glutamate racemase [Fibrobacterota bacterium]